MQALSPKHVIFLKIKTWPAALSHEAKLIRNSEGIDSAKPGHFRPEFLELEKRTFQKDDFSEGSFTKFQSVAVKNWTKKGQPRQ